MQDYSMRSAIRRNAKYFMGAGVGLAAGYLLGDQVAPKKGGGLIGGVVGLVAGLVAVSFMAPNWSGYQGGVQ